MNITESFKTKKYVVPKSTYASIAIVVIFFAMIIFLVYSINKAVRNNTTENIVNLTDLEANTIRTGFYDDVAYLSSLAELYRNSDISIVSQKANEYIEMKPYIDIAVCDFEGKGYFADGRVFDYSEQNKDRFIFETSDVISNFYIKDDGQRCITIKNEVTFEDGKNGRLFGFINLNGYRISSSMNFFGQKGSSYVIDNKTGAFLIYPNDTDKFCDYLSFYDILKESKNDPSVSNTIMTHINNEENNKFYADILGEKSLIYVSQMNTKKSRSVISVIPLNMIDDAGHRIIILVTFISFLIIAFMVLLLFIQRKKGKLEVYIKEREYRDFLLKTLSENIDSVFLVYDISEHKMEYILDNIQRIIGIEMKKVYSDPFSFFDYCEFEDGSDIKDRFINEQIKEKISVDCQIKNPLNGMMKSYNFLVVPTYYSMDSKYYIVYINDISDQINIRQLLLDSLQNAQKANNAKSDFLSSMSHDIRTPMNGIMGMTSIASANLSNTDKVKDCLEKIDIASKHLLNIINEVLDMSKIESGKVSLNDEEFILSEFIEQFRLMIIDIVKSKNQTLDIKIKNIVHDKLIGDTYRIRQIFTNIISNAVKYTHEYGKIEIEIEELEPEINGYGCFSFIFRDNGIGMEEEFLDKIFDPFVRADDSRINKVQGTGLGMTITKNIVEMMTGDISVESSLGEGTCFEIKLDIKINNNIQQEKNLLNGRRILIVDDDPDLCKNIDSILSSEGLKCDYASNGKDAFEKINSAHFSGNDYFALIINWNMSEMSGLELSETVRKNIKKYIPIIIISSHNWTADIEGKFRNIGVDAFISKPVFKSRLMLQLERFLSSTDIENEKSVTENPDFTGKNILLAEDNELNMEIAAEIISMMGANIKCAENGKEALDMFVESEIGFYDLILMDIQMPVMNGLDATQSIRNLSRDDAKTVPIIAMTANAFTDDIKNSEKSGMNEHLSKPLDIKQLINTMLRWL